MHDELLSCLFCSSMIVINPLLLYVTSFISLIHVMVAVGLIICALDIESLRFNSDDEILASLLPKK